MSKAVFIVGDVHGRLENLHRLLRGAGLTAPGGHWAGGASTLCFLGDYTDRGADGIGVIDLILRLTAEAKSVGGQVAALLGNHDILLLAAQRFPGGMFRERWVQNGGNPADLARLTNEHAAWIAARPAMGRVDGYLLMHADSTFYAQYGSTVAEVNKAIRAILAGDNPAAFDSLLAGFSRRFEFDDRQAAGNEAAVEFALRYGGRQIIHGHTPIRFLARPEAEAGPYIYADGMCINVDGGMFLGEPGFVYKLPTE